MGFTHHILDLAAEKCEGEKPLLFILDPAKEDPQPKKKPRKPKGKEPKARPDMDRLTSSPIVLPVLPSAFHIRSMYVGELRLQPQASAVTFGNKFNLEKLINCRALQVAWRVLCLFRTVSDARGQVGTIKAEHKACPSATSLHPEWTAGTGRIPDRPDHVVVDIGFSEQAQHVCRSNLSYFVLMTSPRLTITICCFV